MQADHQSNGNIPQLKVYLKNSEQATSGIDGPLGANKSPNQIEHSSEGQDNIPSGVYNQDQPAYNAVTYAFYFLWGSLCPTELRARHR